MAQKNEEKVTSEELTAEQKKAKREIEQMMKEERNKKQMILYAVLLILIVAYGIWTTHFRGRGGDHMETMPLVATPEDFSTGSNSVLSVPQGDATEETEEEKQLRENIENMIINSELKEHLNDTFDTVNPTNY